jgi:hypothetical protein
VQAHLHIEIVFTQLVDLVYDYLSINTVGMISCIMKGTEDVEQNDSWTSHWGGGVNFKCMNSSALRFVDLSIKMIF